MVAEDNILNKKSIQKYRNDMRRIMSLYYPTLSDNDIYSAIDYSILKRYKNENAILHNNYVKKKASINLTDITDYIMDKKPIITAWGVLFSRKGTVPNPLIKMIKNFMDLRNIHKKEMFKYPKGSEDFEKYNLLQLLDKIDANGTLTIV